MMLTSSQLLIFATDEEGGKIPKGEHEAGNKLCFWTS